MSYTLDEFFEEYLAGITDADKFIATLHSALEMPKCEKFKYTFLHAILSGDNDTTIDKIIEVFDILESNNDCELLSFSYKQNNGTIGFVCDGRNS